jgi:hypothetical protein
MLCCLGLLLSLPSTTSDGSSALAEAKVEHLERGADAPAPLPDDHYPLTLAEESQETDKRPMRASVLTGIVLGVASLWTSVGWLLTTNARGRGAICRSEVENRTWLNEASARPSFLGVFML